MASLTGDTTSNWHQYHFALGDSSPGTYQEPATSDSEGRGDHHFYTISDEDPSNQKVTQKDVYHSIAISEKETDKSGYDGRSSTSRKCLGAVAAWKWEMLALFTSIACILAIIGILSGMRDQPSTAWQLGLITINSAVTVLTTLASIALSLAVLGCLDQEKWRYFKHGVHRLRDFSLLDQGTRGPLNALWIIWRVRWGMASLACLIIILDIGTGFMVQQAIKVEPDYVWTNSTDPPASFPFTQSYDTKGPYYVTNQVTPNLDFPMKAAILRGLSETTWPQNFTCLSNCTWPSSLTVLGFQSSCSDVSNRTANFSKILYENWKATQEFSINLNLTTPGGIVLPFAFSAGAASGMNTAAVLRATAFDGNTTARNGSVVRVAILMTENFRTHDGKVYSRPPESASVEECTVNLVAWEYSAVSADQNTLRVGSRTAAPLVNGTYTPTFAPDASSRILYYPGHINYTLAATGEPFSFNAVNLQNVQDYFQGSEFAGQIYTGFGTPPRLPNSPGGLPAFYGADLSQVMPRVAQSMTEKMQELGSSARRAQGLSQVSVNRVRVHWPWICLPVVVNICAVVLLVSTVMRTGGGGSGDADDRVPLWKSSRTALLFHHLDMEGELVCDVGGPTELEEMERKVVTRLGY